MKKKCKARIILLNVKGEIVEDRVNIVFKNLNVSHKIDKWLDYSQAVDFDGIRVRPVGLYEIGIYPTHYYSSRFFREMESSVEITPVVATLLRRIEDVGVNENSFPEYISLPLEYQKILDQTERYGVKGENNYRSLSTLYKGVLLNIFAKMNEIELTKTKTCLDYVKKLYMHKDPEDQSESMIKLHRIYAIVSKTLLSKLEKLADKNKVFDSADATLHPGFNKSFKSKDPTGILQISLNTKPLADGNLKADIDIDENGGIAHIFDVISHHVTGQETHPWLIWQLLKKQGIQPQYALNV